MEERKKKGLNALLYKFKREKKKEAEAPNTQPQRYEEDSRRRKARAKKLTAGKLLSATKEDYENWLAGFLERGGSPTHFYDRPMNLSNWFIATDDFQLDRLCGANAIHIIVPKNIKFKGGDLGHTSLYFMENFSSMNNWVPVYNDIIFKE